VQLLCIEGKKLLSEGNMEGEKYLNRAMGFSPDYAAHYYIMGKYLLGRDRKEAVNLLFKGAMAPVAASGYSYWDEDDAGVPENMLDEVFELVASNSELLCDEYRNSPYMNFILNKEPYDPGFRFALAEKFLNNNDLGSCIKEMNNVLILTDDVKLKIKVLETLIPIYERSGLMWASVVCRRDIKYLKGIK
jgi:hypothetical protein